MQNWYGLAIRHNADVYTMKKAIGAILWHCTDFNDRDDNYRHRFCPPSTPENHSWCKYQRDMSSGEKTHVNKINLPEFIHKIIEPIFMNLSDDVLLNKCLHGKTQNPNEALNKIIWTKCPKTVFVHKTVIDMGVNSAVLQFNDGLSAISNVFAYFGFQGGYVMNNISLRGDRKSVKKSQQKSSDEGKRRRKRLRHKDKAQKDKETESEPQESYVKGGF